MYILIFGHLELSFEVEIYHSLIFFNSSEEDEQEGAYYSRLTLHNLRRSQIVTDVLSRLEFVTSNDYRRGPPDVTFKDEPGTVLHVHTSLLVGW